MPRKKQSPKTRRARGTGCGPYPDRRRGGYYAKVPVGRYRDGRTKYKEVRDPTHAGCVAKMGAVVPADPDALTVAGLAARWLATLDVASSTRAGYVRQVESRIVPDLGHVPVRELTARHVRAALVNWQDAGTATANRTRRVGATMWNEAAADAPLNPFARCKPLKYRPKELDPFTPDELRAVVGGYRLFAAAPLFGLLAATGARVGEGCALDVSDYDPATGLVAITKTYCVRHGVRPPKSKHSRRTLTVPLLARPAVEFAIGARTDGPLFAKRNGGRYDPGELCRPFEALLSRLGVRRRRIHDLRHTCISLAIAAGAPIADVAAFVGDSPATIVKVYLHPIGFNVSGTLDAVFGR